LLYFEQEDGLFSHSGRPYNWVKYDSEPFRPTLILVLNDYCYRRQADELRII